MELRLLQPLGRLTPNRSQRDAANIPAYRPAIPPATGHSYHCAIPPAGRHPYRPAIPGRAPSFPRKRESRKSRPPDLANHRRTIVPGKPVNPRE